MVDVMRLDTVAVVLTHRRRRLATELVRSLVSEEGFRPEQILLVIDRDGGLDDPELEAAVNVRRLDTQTGPAGGFRVGLDTAFADPQVEYAYLCEDDVALLGLPAPRVAGLIGALCEHEVRSGRPVGAVVAYGRRFSPRRGVTDPFVPPAGGTSLHPVDVAAWGATLVSRKVYDAGVRPDDYWFFGYEDFDFFLKVRAAGLAVLVDRDSAIATAPATSTLVGRRAALADHRPDDSEETWRAYYVARNFFELTRRHGDARWLWWHLVYSARRWQLAGGAAGRRAIVNGFIHGIARRGGRNPRYLRSVGEWNDQKLRNRAEGCLDV